MSVAARILASLSLATSLAIAHAAPSRAPEPGLLALLVGADNAVTVQARPDVFPSSVFEIPINGKATFAQATEKLGAAVVRSFDDQGRTVRYLCYRSGSGEKAIVAIFSSRSPVAEDLIDGFAFAAQSAIPDARKNCREVPWLKPDDLQFGKVGLGMSADKLQAELKLPAGSLQDGKLAVVWNGPGHAAASGAGDTASKIVALSAAFHQGKLVFFHILDGTAVH